MVYQLALDSEPHPSNSLLNIYCICVGLFPRGSNGKESSYNAGDPDSIPGSGRSPGEGNSYPLWYSYLGNLMDRGA